MSDEFPVWQSSLPQILGVSIEEVRVLRDEVLQEGTDWVEKKRRICLTRPAVAKLMAALCVPALSTEKNGAAPASALPGPAQEASPPPSPPPPAPILPELVVHRAAPTILNRYIVEVKRADDPQGVTELLWVRDNTVFKPGMRIAPSSLQARREGQYTYIGRMPPR